MAPKDAAQVLDADEAVAEEVAKQQVVKQQTALWTLAPRMPPTVDAMLHENWAFLDPEADRLLGWMKGERVFHEFAHGRATFFNHLRGTWSVLAHWGQPQAVCRFGLLHSAYTREGFYFRHFEAGDPTSREAVGRVLGPEAEQLIYNYCSTDNPWDPSEWEGRRAKDAAPWTVKLGEPLDPAGYDLPARRDPSLTEHISPEDMAKYFVVFVADIAEQLTSSNSYADVYHNEEPEILWPGECAPGINLHIWSRMLLTARPYLKTVPPIFNHCTEELRVEDELEARTLYWRALSEAREAGGLSLFTPASKGEPMPKQEQERTYLRAAELNPYVAEPHVMLSQLLYNRGAFAEAAHEAVCALDLLYQWGTCWDKRRSWAQWIGFSRMAHLRATRRLRGLPSMPMQKFSESESPDANPVTYLKDLLKEFEELTEKEESGRMRSRL